MIKVIELISFSSQPELFAFGGVCLSISDHKIEMDACPTYASPIGHKANQTNTNADDVHIVGFVDYNAPGARQASKADSLAHGVSLCNDMGISKNNVTMILMPDLPKDSSLRGLYDEERQIIEGLFSQRQDVETRFVDLFTREPRGEARSSMRRWAAGRLVVASDSRSENIWLSSELAVCGRPVGHHESEKGAPCSMLPRSSALLLPENASPEHDLKLAERTRPSPEQTAAQKGQQRLQLLLESLFRHTSVSKPCLIVNMTGYVEELAAAAPRIKPAPLCAMTSSEFVFVFE